MTLVTMGVALLLAGGVALAAIIDGTSGADTINGTENADIIDGLAGSDTIRGLGSADVIDGNSGADSLYGSDGADTIDDGPANDAWVDTISGEDGDDDITAANDPASRDIINCGVGEDRVVADTSDQIAADCEDYTRKLTPEEEALDGPPPPGYDPSTPTDPDGTPEEAFIQEFPLETRIVSPDGTVTTQDISDTNCQGRTDRVHRSAHAIPKYSQALSKTGVWKCGNEKARIWVEANMYRWVPYDNPRWIVVRHKADSTYNTRENIRTLAYHCPVVRSYFHKAVLQNATIVHKDGSRHEMLYPRESDITRVRCEPN